MRLLTPEVEHSLPPLGSTDGLGDRAVAQVKFFTPWTSWTWYATEYDPGERVFFGKVIGHEIELGYFSLDELEAICGPGGLRIERDLHWIPKSLAACQ
jgi:hypothetical protein